MSIKSGPPDAADEYKEAVRLKPDDAKAHFGLGEAYGSLHRYQDAADEYKEAVRLKPDDAKAHYMLGGPIALDNFQEAVGAFKEAIRLKPDDAFAHWELGLTYLDLGDRGAALEEYRILKDLDAFLAEFLFKRLHP